MPQSKKRKPKNKALSDEEKQAVAAHGTAKKATAHMVLNDEPMRALYLITYASYMLGYTVVFEGDLKQRPLRLVVKDGDKEVEVSNYEEYFEPCAHAAAMLQGMGLDEDAVLKILSSAKETRLIAKELKVL